jgi:lysyl-tRNA synthetase class 2
MASPEELKKVRQEKLNILIEKGIDPYPATVNKTHELNEIIESFNNLEGQEVTVAGRVMSTRGQGAILFVDLFDGTGRFQVVLKEDSEIKYIGSEESGFQLFKDTADTGDFIEVTGYPFVTKSGQNSIEVKGWRILTKTLLPIPDEFYGLKDDDDRYRKRYLDILLNEKTRDLMDNKSKFWEVTRNFMKEKGFNEVETPILELTTGGAEATPFKTHHKDFDLDVYLRISVGELWQKRLMAAGMPKTFEIGRVFRNEGSSNEHVQEFTNLEFYWAYADYNDGMELVEDLYKKIAEEVFGTTKFETRGHKFDLGKKWDRIDYVEEIKKQIGIDVLTATEKEMEEKLQELGVKYEGQNKERMTDSLWKYCRKNISGPAFLINHPKIVSPLSKEVRSDENKTQRFQPLIAGSEIGNGYSELNNPIDQEERFNQQQDLIDRGDDEAMMKDDEFVEMLQYGMPPTCGFGFGERLFAFLADKSIREVQTFPLMKPKQ